MDGVKGLLASKTFWGGAVALLAGVLGMFGYTFDGVDQASMADSATAVAADIATGNWQHLFSSVGAVIGGAWAIYGRIKATKLIGK